MGRAAEQCCEECSADGPIGPGHTQTRVLSRSCDQCPHCVGFLQPDLLEPPLPPSPAFLNWFQKRLVAKQGQLCRGCVRTDITCLRVLPVQRCVGAGACANTGAPATRQSRTPICAVNLLLCYCTGPTAVPRRRQEVLPGKSGLRTVCTVGLHCTSTLRMLCVDIQVCTVRTLYIHRTYIMAPGLCGWPLPLRSEASMRVLLLISRTPPPTLRGSNAKRHDHGRGQHLV